MTPETFCNRCGRRNPAQRSTCSLCGAPLAHAVDDATAAHDPVGDGVLNRRPATDETTQYRTGEACLLVTRGPIAGSRFRVGGGTTTIGRDPRNDVFLDDITVSRRQAVIRRRDARCSVVDVGSFNGTYLNGARIDAEALLSDGDDLQIGRFRLVFLAY